MPPNADQFDDHGFLLDRNHWDEGLATDIARTLGITELREPHLAVLHALRQHYRQNRAIPPPMHVCNELDQPEACIDDLFNGPLNAWKIAGLPNPGEEARVYLDNQTIGE